MLGNLVMTAATLTPFFNPLTLVLFSGKHQSITNALLSPPLGVGVVMAGLAVTPAFRAVSKRARGTVIVGAWYSARLCDT